VYLLDQSLNPVPFGEAGEVFVGGVGVARGYLNQPMLTAEKFLPDPFGSVGGRLYRTGDLARYRVDGTLEFVDRVDRQIKLHGYRIELGEIETVLAQHPAVGESAVLVREDPPGTRRLVAYVTQRLDSNSVEEQVEQWRALSDETYRERSANHDPTLNFVGWNSSYDGLPLPEPAIRELVERTADRILALRPQRMLEIGCGTGMLLFRIAPHCAEYWAADFSGEALRYLQQQLDRPEWDLPQVRLLHRAADRFDGLEPGSFDVVALNSVAQYFPSIDYLVQVLEGAVRVTKPGGRVFIGDLRNHDLLTAFHTLVQWRRAPATATIGQLRQRINKHLAQEEELTVAPTFFQALQAHLPRIGHVEMQLKRGRFHNEFTQFRFDVVLHIESKPRHAGALLALDWQEQQLSLDAIERILSDAQPGRVVLTGVPNSRLMLPLRLLELIAAAPDRATVGDLRPAAQAAEEPPSVEPEDLWALEQRLPYSISVMWPEAGPSNTFDVAFERRDLSHGSVVMSNNKHAQERVQLWSSFANQPRPRQNRPQLGAELRRLAQERLPSHMVPSLFVVLDEMPHTINGKIDRAALPAPEFSRPDISGSFVGPRDTIELQLAQIWEEVLQIRPVGITDNFFDLGGHSLLAVRLLTQIHDLFGQELPLSTLSYDPTIEALAVHLRQPGQPRSRSSLVRIQRGGDKPALFCIHPVGGSVLSYADLSRHLRPDQPIYGLYIDSTDDLPPDHRIEALAERYIDAIHSVQPSGPYLLGGWSFGGLVAFEMARQLRAAGQEIALLALLDTWAPLPGNLMADYADDVTPFTFFAKDLERRFVEQLPVLPTSALRHLDPDARLRYLHKLSQIVMGLSAEQGTEQIQRQLAIYQANLRAAAAYLPEGRYPDQITVFQAEEPFSTNPALATLGWNQLSSEPVAVYTVPGNHLTMFGEPHIVALAERLQQCLDEVQARIAAETLGSA
jgi:thioesterase domain-containing protein/ubiquinone/menaquinone biosynthesis C-methylase UbiE/acyl carrier protein